MPSERHIRSAASRHCKRVGRARAHARYSRGEPFAAEESLDKRKHASSRVEIDPGPEQVIHLMRGCARRQTGDFARAELADDADARCQVRPKHTRAALAVDAGGPASGIETDILVVSGNLNPTVFLGHGRAGPQEKQPTYDQ